MEPKTFVCATALELDKWMQLMEDRKYKSSVQPLSPSHCALSYLVSTVGAVSQIFCECTQSPHTAAVSQLPCDEHWKREELKRYLLQAPIWQWEGTPIQHMGQPGCISLVHIINAQRQVSKMIHFIVFFPQNNSLEGHVDS